MNEKSKSILKNLNYTVSANFIVLGISVIINLIVPKAIGIKSYSFWQLYVFYTSYVGFFQFGWLDGIYLKIGGEDYELLDKKKLGTQFWYLFLFVTIIALLIVFLVFIIIDSNDKKYVLLFSAIVLVITNIRAFILYIFQATNRIKEYAQFSRLDRYIYIVLLLLYLSFGGKNFLVLILLDVFSKLLVTICSMIRIKDMLFIGLSKSKMIIFEIIDNIKIGSNLMLSNIASMLIIGISRIFVEQRWSIVTFGKLSFTLSILNMFMTFINAVGIVIFPILRRTNENNLPKIYIVLRDIFVPISFISLILFFPVKSILLYWLPEYRDSFLYMGTLFPMVIYEGRMALLVSTYLKTIRKEKIILYTNIVALIIALIGTYISAFVLNNIYVLNVVIVFSLALRCIIAEKWLLSIMNLNIYLPKMLFFENVLIIIFIVVNITLNTHYALLIYSISLLTYMSLMYFRFKLSLKEILAVIKK